MRIFFLIRSLLLFFLFQLLNVTPVQAQESDRYIYELTPYFEIAENVDIKNTINSDAILIGTKVTINAPINGDLYVIGETVEVNFPIQGSLRVIAGKASVSTIVKESFSFISEDIEIKPTGEIENDAYGYTENIKHDGRIGKDLNISFNPDVRAEINGKIIGNVFHTKGLINGAKSLVQGSIIEIKEQTTEKSSRMDSLISNLFQSLSLILVYIFIKYLRPNLFNKFLQKTDLNYFKLIFKGFLSLVLISFIVGLLAISIIGLPLSIIFMCLVLFSIYISPIFAALLISKKIFKDNASKLLPLSVSVLLVNIIFISPIVGFIVLVLSNLITFGILIEYILDKKHE